MNLRRIAHWVMSTQPLASLVRFLYERRFAKGAARGRFRGVYGDFGAAIASAPRGLPVGYESCNDSKQRQSRFGSRNLFA